MLRHAASVLARRAQNLPTAASKVRRLHWLGFCPVVRWFL